MTMPLSCPGRPLFSVGQLIRLPRRFGLRGSRSFWEEEELEASFEALCDEDAPEDDEAFSPEASGAGCSLDAVTGVKASLPLDIFLSLNQLSERGKR